jgi:Zn-dependent membrane protease YugP
MFIFLLGTVFFLAMAISILAQVYVTYAFDKWGRVENAPSLTGHQVAERIIERTGLSAALASTGKIAGDHYDPRSHTVCLTEKIADRPTVVALAVAAHELGHAQQHEQDTQLIQWRNILLPAVQVGPTASYGLVAAGLFTGFFRLVWLGALVFGVVVIFMFLTLPVEIDASRRGMALLRQSDLASRPEDLKGVRQVLTAAALTYVAASILSLGQLLRYVSLARR